MADSYTLPPGYSFTWEPPLPVNVESDNKGAPAENDKTKVPKKSFMTDYWSLHLIGDPQNPAEKSIRGLHPQWEEIYKVFQFVDPCTNDFIAYWDCTHDYTHGSMHGRPYFYNYGYLWVHPKIKGKFVWTWSPFDDPFAAERGKYKFNSNHTLPPEMFGPFGSAWCKMVLGEVGVSSHDDATPSSFWLQVTEDFFKTHNFFIMEK